MHLSKDSDTHINDNEMFVLPCMLKGEEIMPLKNLVRTVVISLYNSIS